MLTTGHENVITVRQRQVDGITASNPVEANIRVLMGKRSGAAFATDVSEPGLELLIAAALENASLSNEDAHTGLPEPCELGSLGTLLDLYSSDVEHLEIEHRVRFARETEDAALACDSRITSSDRASFISSVRTRVLANSQGFVSSFKVSECSIDVAPVARDGRFLERDYWSASSCSLARLESPAMVGRTAAKRALRHLRSSKVPTGRFPVVFEANAAGALVWDLLSCIHGRAVYRKVSCLTDLLGVRIASDNLTVIDDGSMPGLEGSSPFDDEGVRTRRTVIIDRGVLKSYLLNSYAARRLGLRTTGNAVRGQDGNAGIGPHNLYLEKGDLKPAAIIGGIKNGLYVTDLTDRGLDLTSGNFSRGARGLWIRNGELAFPVSGITIAGNLRQMLMDIEAIGSDLEFRGSVAAPTLLVRELTVGGS